MHWQKPEIKGAAAALSSYMRVPVSSNYTFFLDGGQYMRVVVTHTGYPKSLGIPKSNETIFSHTGGHVWSNAPLESKKIFLTKGEWVVLEGLCWDSKPGCWLNIGMRISTTTVPGPGPPRIKGGIQYGDQWSTHRTVEGAETALQRISVFPAGHQAGSPLSTTEMQVITVAGANGGSFSLSFDGGSTAPLPWNATALMVESELNKARAVQCTVSDPSDQAFFDSDTFENATDIWIAQTGHPYEDENAPILTSEYEPHCGTYALYMKYSRGTNFVDKPFDTNDFPYVCMAYKIPATTKLDMMITREDPSGKKKVHLIGIDGAFDDRHGIWSDASWNKNLAGDGEEPLIRDDSWHYKCINLDNQLDNKFGNMVHKIHTVQWGGYIRGDILEWSSSVHGSFQIDDFSISKRARTITRTPKPQWQPHLHVVRTPFNTASNTSNSSETTEYRGTQSRTRSGRTCQKWTAQSPHQHSTTGLGDHNYCRARRGDTVEFANGKPTTQSSLGWGGASSKAVDGSTAATFSTGQENSCTHTNDPAGTRPWWSVDLEQETQIESVQVWNRGDQHADRLNGIEVRVGSATDWSSNALCGTVSTVPGGGNGAHNQTTVEMPYTLAVYAQ